jgi:hypothetical protein
MSNCTRQSINELLAAFQCDNPEVCPPCVDDLKTAVELAMSELQAEVDQLKVTVDNAFLAINEVSASLSALSGISVTYSSGPDSPIGVVTPTLGSMYFQTSNNTWWKSTGDFDNTWVVINEATSPLSNVFLVQ